MAAEKVPSGVQEGSRHHTCLQMAAAHYMKGKIWRTNGLALGANNITPLTSSCGVDLLVGYQVRLISRAVGKEVCWYLFAGGVQ